MTAADLILRLDESLGCAVCGIDEVDVFRRPPRRVDSKHGEGMLEDLRQSVDGAFLKKTSSPGWISRGASSVMAICAAPERT